MALKINPPTLLEVAPYAKSKAYWLWRRYRLTPDGFHALWSKQTGRCAICDVLMVVRKPNKLSMNDCCVDHDAETKQVRGLLCRRCNSVIGYMKHDPNLLQASILYLHETMPHPPK